MRLIDQKQIFSFYALSKKTLQMSVRIKHIIIITDYGIHPDCSIKPQFKWTYLPFLRLFFQHASGDCILSCDQFINCIIHPVKMSLCIKTVLRIALRFIAKTDLLFCSQRNHFILQSLFFQSIKCTCGCRSGNRLCCQIKDLFSKPFTHCLHRRKHGCQSLPRTCRCLNK